MNKDIKVSLGFGIVFLLVVIVCVSFIVQSVSSYDSGTNKYFSNDNIVLENELSEILDKQMDCDSNIEKLISKMNLKYSPIIPLKTTNM